MAQASNALNVCHVVHAFYPEIGGAERLVWQLTRALAREGVRSLVLTRRPNGSQLAHDSEDVSVWGPELGLRSPWGTLLYLGRVAWQLVRRRAEYTLVNTHLTTAVSLTAVAVARVLSKPVVARIGCSGSIPKLERALGSWLWLRLLTGADRLVAINDAIAEEARAAGVAPERIVRITNGIEFPSMETSTCDARRVLGMDASFIALFVGRLVLQKQLNVLLDAWAAVAEAAPDACLILVGDGGLRPHLEAQQRSLGLEGRVVLTGAVTDPTPYYRSADVFVHPSMDEGFPLSLLEAMAHGVTSVASRIPGHDEMIEDGVNGLLFDVGDARALTDCLLRLQHDPGLRRRFGDAARETVARHYTIDAVAGEYLKMYNRLLEERRAA